MQIVTFVAVTILGCGLVVLGPFALWCGPCCHLRASYLVTLCALETLAPVLLGPRKSRVPRGSVNPTSLGTSEGGVLRICHFVGTVIFRGCSTSSPLPRTPGPSANTGVSCLALMAGRDAVHTGAPVQVSASSCPSFLLPTLTSLVLRVRAKRARVKVLVALFPRARHVLAWGTVGSACVHPGLGWCGTMEWDQQ